MTPTAMLEAPQELLPAVKVKRKLSQCVFWNARAKCWAMRFYDVDGSMPVKNCPDLNKTEAKTLLADRKKQVQTAIKWGLKSVEDYLRLEQQARAEAKTVEELYKAAGQRARQEGKPIDDVLHPENAGPKLKEFGEEFLKVRSKGIESHSAASYSSYLRNHIVPVFGGKTLRQINRAMIEEYRDNRRGEGASEQQVVHELNFMSGLFSHAINGGKLEVNPCSGVKHPKIPKPTPRWLGLPEENCLLPKLKDGGMNLRSAFIVSIETGMREDEQMQMTWAQVDWELRTITLNDTKNGEGRVIHLTDYAYDTLKAIKQQQEKLDLKTPYVWINLETKLPYDRFNQKPWRKALADAGIKNYRWHDNRHSWATRLRHMGKSLDEIMELGGWKSYKLVLRYAHIKPLGTASAVKSLAEWRTIMKGLLKSA